jgi:hypothetical protein
MDGEGILGNMGMDAILVGVVVPASLVAAEVGVPPALRLRVDGKIPSSMAWRQVLIFLYL